MNRSLHAAKAARQDEFYTQYVDIQKEPVREQLLQVLRRNFNKLGLKKLLSTSYDGSPIAGQYTLFPEYNEGNGKRQKPKALAVIVEHVKDEDGDGAANVSDVELFLKRNKAARIALKGDPDKYPGGDFRSSEGVGFLAIVFGSIC